MDCLVNSQYLASDSSLPLLLTPLAFPFAANRCPFDACSIGLWPLDIWPLFEVWSIFNWSLDMVLILRLEVEVLGEQGESSRRLLIFLTFISRLQILLANPSCKSLLEILLGNLGNLILTFIFFFKDFGKLDHFIDHSNHFKILISLNDHTLVIDNPSHHFTIHILFFTLSLCLDHQP